MHSKLNKVIVNKNAMSYAYLGQTRVVISKKKQKNLGNKTRPFFGPYQSKQNSSQNCFKKYKKFINCPISPNQPKSHILPKDFIRRTLRIGTYLGK
jgi:hypothetical protein